jgi:hypothetical protein
MRTLAGPQQRCVQQTAGSSRAALPLRRTCRQRSSLHVVAVLEKEEPKLAPSEAVQHLEHLLPPSLSQNKPPARHLSPGEPNMVFYFAYVSLGGASCTHGSSSTIDLPGPDPRQPSAPHGCPLGHHKRFHHTPKHGSGVSAQPRVVCLAPFGCCLSWCYCCLV